MAKDSEKGPFGGSKTDRRVSGQSERRVAPVGHVHREFPKFVYHKETGEGKIVADEDEVKALGKDYADDAPFDSSDRDAAAEAIAKGDGGNAQPIVQKVEVVNTEKTALDAKVKGKR